MQGNPLSKRKISYTNQDAKVLQEIEKILIFENSAQQYSYRHSIDKII